MSKKSEIHAADSSVGTHQCVLCCENITVFAIGVCDHPVCFRCSARMRVLADQRYCSVCRTNLEQVVFSKTLKDFSSMTLKDMSGTRKYGIRFASKDCSELFNDLLESRCPLCKDNVSFRAFADLRTHVRKEHNRQYCDICTNHLHVFPIEHQLYSRQDLVKHRKGSEEKNSLLKGHPLCRFCDERFYDSDELLGHLRKNHFWCHFCENDGKQEYYCNYPELRSHFSADHFLCEEGQCEAEQFTSVFRTKLDLQAHRVSSHSNNLTKASARQARQVDIDLDYGPRRKGKRENTGAAVREAQAVAGSNQNEARANTSPIIHRAAAVASASSVGHVSVVPNPRNVPVMDPQVEAQRVPSASSLIEERATKKVTPQAEANPVSTSKENQTQKSLQGNWATGGLRPSQLNESNFPSLSTSKTESSQPSKAPPGFSNVVKRIEPPGLFTSSKNSNVSNSNKRQGDNVTRLVSNGAVDTGSGAVIRRAGPPGFGNPSENDRSAFQARNQRLIQTMHSLLQPKGFETFRMLSGQYRREQIDAVTYYNEIRTLLGSNLHSVFSELVDLLPDSDKRSELLAVHRDYKLINPGAASQKGDKSWKDRKKKNLVSESSALDADFPALQSMHQRKRIAGGIGVKSVPNAWSKK